MLDHWQATGKVERAQIASLHRFLAAQAPGRQQA
jgi:hypothetical protein